MRLAATLMGAALAVIPAVSAAQNSCRTVKVADRAEARGEELTLADFLANDTCPPLRAAAKKVSLGAPPRAGGRVFEGSEIRLRIEQIAIGKFRNQTLSMEVPDRIVVRRGGAAKSCLEIAHLLASEASLKETGSDARRWENEMDCAGARAVPADAQLELTRSRWNPALQRWEFALRCEQAEQCIPFLVWRRAVRDASGRLVSLNGMSSASAFSAGESTGVARGDIGWLVKPGQTATLSWDGAGIRIVLPVTCLDAGRAGELVRVRFKNAAHILRAEVLGDGTLRARL
jgi:flagellar basal body P-ring formation chaperone FlgA